MGLPFIPDDASFETKAIAYLTEVHTKLEQLMGNGQPGVIKTIEKRLAVLEQKDSYHKGRRNAWSAVIASLTTFGILLIVELARGLIRK